MIFSSSVDRLCAIYFASGDQVELLQHNELQARLGRNDILGENPCDTAAAEKSHCVVRDIRKELFCFIYFHK